MSNTKFEWTSMKQEMSGGFLTLNLDPDPHSHCPFNYLESYINLEKLILRELISWLVNSLTPIHPGPPNTTSVTLSWVEKVIFYWWFVELFEL